MDLVERLRSRAYEHRHHRKYREEAAQEIDALRAENERLKADAARLDSGRIALWGPGAVQPDGRCDDVQTEHSGVDLRKAIDEAIEMATPEWRATYCRP